MIKITYKGKSYLLESVIEAYCIYNLQKSKESDDDFTYFNPFFEVE